MAYNAQNIVNAKNYIPVDFKVNNFNDSKAMGARTRRCKTILGHTDFTLLYGKDYHTGTEFQSACMYAVQVLIAVSALAAHAPDWDFDVENFVYNKENDTYTYMAQEILHSNGRWFTKMHGKTAVKIKHYKTKACLSCEFVIVVLKMPKVDSLNVASMPI